MTKAPYTLFGTMMDAIGKKMRVENGDYFEHVGDERMSDGTQSQYQTNQLGHLAAGSFAKVFKTPPDLCDLAILNECLRVTTRVLDAWLERSTEISKMPFLGSSPLPNMVVAFAAGTIAASFEATVDNEEGVDRTVLRGFHALGMEYGRRMVRDTKRWSQGKKPSKIETEQIDQSAVIVSVNCGDEFKPMSFDEAREIANAVRAASRGETKGDA